MKFNERLKVLRETKRLTQEKLGNDLGLAKSTISMYERGERMPDFETMEIIADYFNVTLSSLVDYKNSSVKYFQFDLSNHEQKLIESYRNKPEMQSAVDTLLGISDEKTNENRKIRRLEVATETESSLIARTGERKTIEHSKDPELESELVESKDQTL